MVLAEVKSLGFRYPKERVRVIHQRRILRRSALLSGRTDQAARFRFLPDGEATVEFELRF